MLAKKMFVLGEASLYSRGGQLVVKLHTLPYYYSSPSHPGPVFFFGREMLRACRGCRLLLRTTGGARRDASTVVLAAIVERLPLLVPELPTWQREAVALRERVAAGSAKQYPSEFIDAEEGPDRKQARERVEGLIQREASRLGSGDQDDDERIMDRRLAQRLYLLANGANGKLQFPQARWEAGGIRETLAAALAQSCGDGLDWHFLGNAPIAHWADKEREVVHFFFRVQLLGGGVNGKCVWLPKEELAERLEGGGPLVLEMCGPQD